jgi:NodT family efflux transporter outer membrane factor (OMF) lipoprotein
VTRVVDVARSAWRSAQALAPVCSIAGLLALTACATTPEGAQRARFDPASLPPQTTVTVRQGRASHIDPQWWRAFDDPGLDALMDRALEQAPSLAQAQVRLERAQAVGQEAASALGPALAASSGASRTRTSESGLAPPQFSGRWITNSSLGANLSWALDLWGANRDAAQAARLQAVAADADAETARLALTTAIARTWMGLSRAEELVQGAVALEEGRRTLLDLNVQRNAAGIEAGVQRARQNLADVERELEARRQVVRALRFQLAVLAGMTPDDGLALPSPVPDERRLAGIALPSTLPAELVARRPEVAAALARVEAGRRQEAVARKAFLPNVNLNAFVGQSAIGLEHLLESGSFAPSAGPAISLPIFNGGRLAARLAGSQADTDAAVIAYESAVLDALKDVVQAATALEAARAQAAQASITVESLTIQLDHARQKLERGIISRVDFLTVQDGVIIAARARTEADANLLEASVDLIRALGGGYQSTATLSPAGQAVP